LLSAWAPSVLDKKTLPDQKEIDNREDHGLFVLLDTSNCRRWSCGEEKDEGRDLGNCGGAVNKKRDKEREITEGKRGRGI